MLARHLDLPIVGKDDHVVAVLYHRDLAKHPNVQILSEGSQDQHIRFSSDFSSHEATKNQVTQHLDWHGNFKQCGIQRWEQSTKCSEAARIKDPPWANHTTAATCDSTFVGCSIANTLAGPRRTNFSTKATITTAANTPLAPSKVSHQLSNCWISQHT